MLYLLLFVCIYFAFAVVTDAYGIDIATSDFRHLNHILFIITTLLAAHKIVVAFCPGLSTPHSHDNDEADIIWVSRCLTTAARKTEQDLAAALQQKAMAETAYMTEKARANKAISKVEALKAKIAEIRRLKDEADAAHKTELAAALPLKDKAVDVHNADCKNAAASQQETDLGILCREAVEAFRQEEARADRLEEHIVEARATITTLTTNLNAARQRANNADDARTAAMEHANRIEEARIAAVARADALEARVVEVSTEAVSLKAQLATALECETTFLAAREEEMAHTRSQLGKKQMLRSALENAHSQQQTREDQAAAATMVVQQTSVGGPSRAPIPTFLPLEHPSADGYGAAAESLGVAILNDNLDEMPPSVWNDDSNSNAGYSIAVTPSADYFNNVHEQPGTSSYDTAAPGSSAPFTSDVASLPSLPSWINHYECKYGISAASGSSTPSTVGLSRTPILPSDMDDYGYGYGYDTRAVPDPSTPFTSRFESALPLEPVYNPGHFGKLPDNPPAEVPQEVSPSAPINMSAETGATVAGANSHEGTFFRLDSSASTSRTSLGVEPRLSANADNAMAPPLGGGLQASEFTYNVEPRLLANAGDDMAPLFGGLHAGGSTRIFNSSFFGNIPSNAGQKSTTNVSRKTTSTKNRRHARRGRK